MDKWFTTRSAVILLLTVSAGVLAYLDPSVRPSFMDLTKVALGGYLGQLIPRSATSRDELK